MASPSAKVVFDKLLNGRRSGGPLSSHSGSGVYAIFVIQPGRFWDTVLLSKGPEKGLVYIGETKDVKTRNHFNQPHSGYSTLRRSIGSILEMKGEPRKVGGKKVDYQNFRFSNSDEGDLSIWMHSNLEYSFYQFNGDLELRKNLESLLIANYKPSLNLALDLWRISSQGREIMGLRNKREEEARGG